MKTSRLISLLAILFMVPALMSCFSTMRLRVDALNMPAFKLTYLYTAEYLDNIDKQVAALVTTEYKQKLREETLGKVIEFINTSPKIFPDNQVRLTAAVTALYNPAIDKVSVAAVDLLAKTKSVKTAATPGAIADHEISLATYQLAVNDFSRVLLGYKDLLLTAVGTSEVEALTMLNRNIMNSATKVKTSFGESILSDPMSSVIATLPKQYWRKYKSTASVNLADFSKFDKVSTGRKDRYSRKASRINLTKAKTFIGNSDLAFKMESPGEFVVKGVRVDADEAVRAASKVLAQGIKYMAYSAGIPVKGPTGNQETIIPEVQGLASRQAQLQGLKDKYSVESEAFLAILISASNDVKRAGTSPADVAARAAALARVKKAYENYKAGLTE